MADMARKFDEREEFWRPAIDNRVEHQRTVTTQPELCPACGADFVTGSRFCHVCGSPRYGQDPRTTRSFDWPSWLDIRRIREAVGLPLSSLVALFVGMVCVICAVAVGLMYTANTVLDWQAVQIWRVEWLLGAITAFVAGILLKRKQA